MSYQLLTSSSQFPHTSLNPHLLSFLLLTTSFPHSSSRPSRSSPLLLVPQLLLLTQLTFSFSLSLPLPFFLSSPPPSLTPRLFHHSSSSPFPTPHLIPLTLYPFKSFLTPSLSPSLPPSNTTPHSSPPNLLTPHLIFSLTPNYSFLLLSSSHSSRPSIISHSPNFTIHPILRLPTPPILPLTLHSLLPITYLLPLLTFFSQSSPPPFPTPHPLPPTLHQLLLFSHLFFFHIFHSCILYSLPPSHSFFL